MRRTLLICSVLAALGTTSAAAETHTYFGFQITVGNAPPPPRFVHREEPRLVLVPSLDVYVVANDDYDSDVFRYGAFWYVCDGGYWYRARSYRGPYALINVRSVPTPIFYVPRERWRHHEWGPRWVRERGHEAARQASWERARVHRHEADRQLEVKAQSRRHEKAVEKKHEKVVRKGHQKQGGHGRD
jgi:hypothetical protein